MKPVSQVNAVVVDYGSFISLADKLAETMASVSYYRPHEEEFLCVADCCKGDGLDKVVRIEDFFDPQFIAEIDLFVFPDIGYGGLQRYLRSIGKAVWGSMGADELELYRTRFIKTVKEMGLPVIHTETVRGLAKLREYLKTVKDKWVKINKYRANMETWHHLDFEHSRPELDRLAAEFGGLQDHVVFVVQDVIETDVEIGYDGWCVDGQFPAESFQGYEKKNELYLGSLLAADKLPKEVQRINKALAPLLKQFGYRNFIATEIRVKDGVPYFIDPTLRMPGQTGEQMLETCSNLADVIWHGANGQMLKPVFKYKFAAEATMHNTAGGEWGVLKIPDKVKQWFKLYHYCKADGFYHFPPKVNMEFGVVLGCGNTIEAAIDALKVNLDAIKEEPVKCKLEGFVDLLRDIKDAEKQGVTFTTQKIPSPVSVLGK